VEEWKRKKLEGSAQKNVISLLLLDFTRYLKDERRSSEGTLDAYERDLLRFIGELEERGHSLFIRDITADDVRSHMHRLMDRKLSPASVRRALHAMGSFFRWAVVWELVPHNPVARITIPRRVKTREVRALSGRERSLCIAAADGLATTSQRLLDRQAPLFIRLMLKTGLRRGEVIALTWSDIDLERGELLVRHGKGDKSRRVPVEDVDLLARLRAARPVGTETKPVFINGAGKAWTTSSFYRVFHRVLRKAELYGKGITPHSLRHTFGSVLCARGVPVPYVKDLLGHADIGSTMVYVHSTPAALRQAVRKLRE
jgi:site-specific recombinase XerD